MSLIEDLTQFPLYCSYVLLDESTGSAALYYSNGNAVNQLATTITHLRRGIHDNKPLQDAYDRGSITLKVLSQYKQELPDVVLRANAHLLFKNAGYSHMNGKDNKVEYKLQATVFPDYRNQMGKVPLVYVSLKSKAIGAIMCGVFEDMMQAERYIARSGEWTEIVFANNELTRKYHREYGYVVKKIRDWMF